MHSFSELTFWLQFNTEKRNILKHLEHLFLAFLQTAHRMYCISSCKQWPKPQYAVWWECCQFNTCNNKISSNISRNISYYIYSKKPVITSNMSKHTALIFADLYDNSKYTVQCMSCCCCLSLLALVMHHCRPHLVNARNWSTSRLPCRGSVSSRWGSKGTGSVGSRTSATCPLQSTMSGKPAE